MLHNPSRADLKLTLADAGLEGLELTAVAGVGSATLEDGILRVEAQTSVILR